MSIETARAILEGMADVAPEPWRTHFARALEELETPEERRKRREREKKRAQRANGSKGADPPDKPSEESGPVPSVSPSASPIVSPAGPENRADPSRALPSLSSSSDPSPLSLLSPSETPSQTAESARGRKRKGVRTGMPDPDADPQAFEAFVRRWSLPMSPILSPTASPSGPLSDAQREARKFMAYALKNGAQYVRWDWAWRDWLARSGDFPSGVHRAAQGNGHWSDEEPSRAQQGAARDREAETRRAIEGR